MESTRLIQWLRHPETLDTESLVVLKDALGTYPCFTTLRILYQKNLLELQDDRFSNELVRTAISSPDRRRLFLFMEGRTEECLNGVEPRQPVSGDDFSLIDRFLKQATDYATQVGGSIPENDTPPVLEVVPTPVLESDEVVDEFGLGGFSLDYLGFKDELVGQEATPSTPLLGQDLIDAFLENGFTTGPLDNDDDLSEEAAVEALIDTLPEDSFSEALAKIYLKQKRYDKALEIIKSLRLKYPEKNSYFADQIRYLEKLILTTKQ